MADDDRASGAGLFASAGSLAGGVLKLRRGHERLHPFLAYAVAELRVPELGGPDALTPLEVVSIFETLAHQRFAITHVLDSALHLRYASASDPMQKSFAALMLGIVRGDWIPMTGLLRQIPVRLTSVQEYAAAHVPQVAPV